MSIYDFLKKFKEFCRSKQDWKIGEEGDWIRDREGCRAIVWGRSLKPCTVRSMVRSGKVSIRDGESWTVENAKLMIFISENLTDEVLDEIEDSKEIQGRAVLYDVARGLKVGSGDSISTELEKFLVEESGITLRSLRKG